MFKINLVMINMEMERTEEYYNKCFEIYTKGGILWLIERTDTNEFCYKQMKMWQSNKPETWRDTFLWSKDISFFHVFFLTKEDAEEELQWMNLNEGGCHCCGHGSTKIPIEITEHEFILNK